MSVNYDRLNFELNEVWDTYHGRYSPVENDEAPEGSWGRYGVQGYHRGYSVGVLYDEDHPYRPPRVGLSPRPSSRHYYDDGNGWHLCYCKPEEWNSRYTLATTLAIVLRFIDEFSQGKVD